jgi:protein-disulfide isomerase
MSDDEAKRGTVAGKDGNKPKKESEATENMVAIGVFVLLIIAAAALFTNGFGLFSSNGGTGINTNERVQVQIGDAPYKGDLKSPVVMIAFSDYECPYCKDAESKINDISKKYDGKMLMVFKNFPLKTIHKDAYNASLAAECANEQKKFWEYHDYLFQHNENLGPQYLEQYAVDLGLDAAQFNNCFESKRYAYRVEADVTDGMVAGVSSTPTFFINGIRVVGDLDEKEYTKVIDSELKAKGQ